MLRFRINSTYIHFLIASRIIRDIHKITWSSPTNFLLFHFEMFGCATIRNTSSTLNRINRHEFCMSSVEMYSMLVTYGAGHSHWWIFQTILRHRQILSAINFRARFTGVHKLWFLSFLNIWTHSLFPR